MQYIDKIQKNTFALLLEELRPHSKFLQRVDAAERLQDSIFRAACTRAAARNIAVDFTAQKFCTIYAERAYYVICALQRRGYFLQRCIAAMLFHDHVAAAALHRTQITHCGDQNILDCAAALDNTQLDQHEIADVKNFITLRAQQYVKQKTTRMFTCPQCKQREATYRKKQVRGGDEGYTFFFTCCKCNYNWAQNS